MDRDRLRDINSGAGAPGGLAAEPDPGRITGGGQRVQPDPLADVRGGSEFTSPIAPVTPKMRQQVRAAVAFHVGGKLPGLEFSRAVEPITDRFVEMAADNPALVAAVEQDVNALFALTDMDIAERVMRGQPISQFGDVWDSMAEVAWEIGATDLAARLEADRADAIKGTFDGLTQVEALQLAGDGTELADVSRFTRVDPRGGAKAQTFQTLFDVPGAWSYSPTSGLLAVTVGDQTVGVKARPGFNPESHLDVMAEVVSAQADGRLAGGELTGGQRGNIQVLVDKAHEIGAWLDEHPTARNTVDGLAEGFLRSVGEPGAVVRGVTGDNRGPLERGADALKDESGRMTEQSVRLASIIPFPEDATIAAIARRWIEDNPGLESQDALTLAAESVAENREQFVSEFESLTQEELIRELETDLGERSGLGTAIESTIQGVVDKMEAWDSFTQWLGVNVIDLLVDQWSGYAELAQGDWQEGFERFSGVFDAPEADTAAEYFDLEGTAADAVNLAVGIGFDPLNLLLPGGKGLRAIAQRALTNPIKYGRVYLKMGSTRRVIEQIAGTSRLRSAADDVARGATQVDEARAARQALNESGVPYDMTVGEAEAVYGAASPEAAAVRRVAEAPPLTPLDETDELGTVLDVGGVRVDRNAAKAVRNVGSMVNLEDPEIIDLVNLALDPNSTTEQVEDVLLRALHKDWLGDGPMRAVHLKTVEGVGRALESIAGGHLSGDTMDTVMKLVAKLSNKKTLNLGENLSLNEAADLVTQFFPADKDAWTEWWLRAVQARSSGGDELALAGAAAMQKEQARRAIWETGGTIRSVSGSDDIATVNQNLRTIEDNLANLSGQGLDEATEAAVRESLERTHAVMSRRVDEATPVIQNAHQKRRHAHRQLNRARALEADQAANAARNNMARWSAELYEDVAQRLNSKFGREVIPVEAGKVNPLAPDVPVRDWSAVSLRKHRKSITDDSNDLAIVMGLAGDDVDLARQLDAMGMFRRSQHVTLPASPYEVILFEKIGHNETLLSQVTSMFRREWVKSVGGGMRAAFGVNLLLNPISALRITLDPTLRFLADTGAGLKAGRAGLAGIPVVGRATEAAVTSTRQTAGRLADAEGWFADKFGGPLRRYATQYGDSIVNPYGLSYQRNVQDYTIDDHGRFDWVERPARRVGPGQMSREEYRRIAERWVNGTLIQQPHLREYARWIDEATVLEDGTKIAPPGFIDWWEHGAGAGRPGKADARPIKITIRDHAMMGTELTAQDAFSIIDTSFSLWLQHFVEEPRQAVMRRTLIQALRGARGGLDVVGDASLLNAIKRVPGLDRDVTLRSQVFQTFFGAPAGRTAGVYHELHFDDAFKTLKQRHAGQLLTVDRLMEYANVDRETAQHWLRQGADNKIVSQLLREGGARTEAQLAAKAAAYAQRRADDYLYRFTATSLVGRGVESALVLPFARAQVDFLSWWTNHMFKPMTVRMSPEMRARLPQAVNTLVQGVERLPLNLRAWAKYAHVVAAAENEHPSVIDQTIDNFTFLPLRFGNDFLLDVSPQLGPVPSLLFDWLVDAGVVGEEVEENFHAIFPALEFTEFDGDLPGDFINRWLPNSKRSLRDFMVGMMRAGYALGGEDIHTDPGFMGQIANLIAENKVPAATGDFQAAGVADMFAGDFWSLVPGSPEWNDQIIDVAVTGAVEANRQEWSRDLTHRTAPLAGADREYRALGAFEGMFKDATFADLARAGVLQANDLEEIDGQARIVGVWDRYQAGEATAEDLAWLDDRLTTAYFEAGRVDILPGFSFMDWLHLNNPEIAVNLINKSEDSGIPARGGPRKVGDEQLTHAQFRQKYVNRLTDRLQNVPPGDAGREVVADARRYGWLTSRPVEEWATDAATAVYKSGQRAVRGVWEWVSHRTWTQGLKQSIEDKTFVLPDRAARILDAAGLSVDAGTEFTYKEFHELLDTFDERFKVDSPTIVDTLRNGTVHSKLARHNDEFGQGLLENLSSADREFSKLGIDSIDDWPEASKVEVRRLFTEAINLGYVSVGDYQQELEPLFGAIDYEPPTPPPVAELEAGISLSGDELQDLEVVDGDTLSVLMENGPMRVRLIGLNAPEITQEGYQEATNNLAEVIADANEVVLGIYRPDQFGMTQLSAPGERRLLAWIYVDLGNGPVALYDPTVFTADNPRGSGVGGTLVDVRKLVEKR